MAKELKTLQIENLFFIGFAGGALALLFALIRLGRLRRLSVGDEPARDLAEALRKGTHAYLKWQLLFSGIGLVLVFGCLADLAYLELLDWLCPAALLSGGLCGLLSGVVGAKVTAAGGPRCAQAAGVRLDRGVDAALSAGAVISFLAVGLGLVHVTLWFFLLKYGMGYAPEVIARTLLLLGLGSALSSLLLRMGAVFARSAGMAAEIVDREMGLPPDDPKNPTAIADRVGYGVGNAAGMAAGLSCAYENSLFAALFLGHAAFAAADMAWNAILLPLAVAAVGVLASLIGFLTVRPRERGDRYSLPWTLRFAALVSAVLTATASVPLTYFLMGSWTLCLPLFAGLAVGFLIPLAGEYFTADTYRPARSLADTAETGAVAVVSGGLGAGLCAAALPVLLIAAALAVAFWSAGGTDNLISGLYGIALVGVGMLAVSGVSWAAAGCGSVGDCAAHTASLIDAEEAPRRRADNLASIGSAAANGGKCLAAASTVFTGLSLLPCLTGILKENISGQRLLWPESLLLMGVLLGIMVVLLFLGLLLLAVRKTVKATLLQARSQFQDNDELIEGSEAPDYASCVGRCSTRSLTGSLLPNLLALAAPVAAGALLGPWGLLGFLGCVLILCVTLSLFFSLSGGILSGARRYVESGRKGGRGGDCHRSTLTAERALAPLSQVAGPALLSLARLAILLALAAAALVSAYNLPLLLG